MEGGDELQKLNGEVSVPLDGDVEDDDPLVLSSQALAALQEFLADQNKTVSSTPVAASVDGEDDSGKVELVTEDWRLSQFWYEPETAETVAEEVVTLSSRFSGCRVACIACPTLYVYLKKRDPSLQVQLLEYDMRFERYGSEFTFYDYNEPEKLPLELKHCFHIIVADPPYLSRECLEGVTKTISFLARPVDSLLLLLTGEVQRERAADKSKYYYFALSCNVCISRSNLLLAFGICIATLKRLFTRRLNRFSVSNLYKRKVWLSCFCCKTDKRTKITNEGWDFGYGSDISDFESFGYGI